MSNLPLVGSRFQNKQGHWYTVIEANGCKDVTVKFDIRDFVKKTTVYYVKNGIVKLPSIFVGDIVIDKVGNIVTIVKIDTVKRITFQWEDGYQRTCQHSVVNNNTLMREEDSQVINPSIKVGDKFTNNQGSVLKVVDYIKASEIIVEFDSPVNYSVKTNMANLKKGTVSNKYLPSVAGVGILGGFSVDCSTKMYQSWAGMLKRVYSQNALARAIHYRDCSVDEKWFYVENFSHWFHKQVVQDNWHLDKDLIVKDNKIYSEDTCIFVPREVNTFLTDRFNFRGEWPVGVTYHERLNKWQATCNVDGKSEYLGVFNDPVLAFNAYKECKERYAKTLAGRWQGLIDERGVVALTNFTVNIDA